MTADAATLINDLSGPNWSSAWHCLVERGPDMQLVTEAYSLGSTDVQVHLLGVLREWRVPESVPLAVRALESAEPKVWKAALDVLVTLGSGPAIEAMRGMLAVCAGTKREWVKEAINQATSGPG